MSKLLKFALLSNKNTQPNYVFSWVQNGGADTRKD